MALSILFIQFILIFLFFYFRYDNVKNTISEKIEIDLDINNEEKISKKTNNFNPNYLMNSYIKTLVIFSSFLVFITEALSLVNNFNYSSIFLSWLFLSFTFVVVLLPKKQQILGLEFSSDITLKPVHKLFLTIVILTLGLVFFQGLLYPPNTYDAMSYHLSRIVHWISQENVLHFPTHIVRQINQPPFTEFFIAHVNILSGNDILSNSIEFLFLVSSIISLLLFSNQIGLNKEQKWLMVLLLLTIPQVVLEASSTQNNLVVAFFVITAIYFAIESLKEFSLENILFLSLSFGLGILTKGTSYIYLLPVISIWGVLTLKKMNENKEYSKYFLSYLIFIIISLSLNFGHYSRNYQLTESLLGHPKSEFNYYVSEEITPKSIISNVTRNIFVNNTFPYLKDFSEAFVNSIHNTINQKINDSKTTMDSANFTIKDFGNHEDTAGNFIHLYLFIVCFIFLLIYRKNYDNKLLYLGSYIVIVFIMFSIYLKWQPWITRLQMPFYMLSTPLVAYMISKDRLKALNIGILSVLVSYSFLVIIFNKCRPYITITPYTMNIKLSDLRFKKYFINNSELLFPDYFYVYLRMGTECKRPALIIRDNDYEYPLFKDIYTMKIDPMHIYVKNFSNIIPVKGEPDCIIAPIGKNVKSVKYNGSEYMNTAPFLANLFLYKKDK